MTKSILFAVLVAASTVCHAADDLKKRIQTEDKKICAAMMKKDFATLDKLMKASMTKDFQYVENGQTQTYAQMMEGMKMGLGGLKKVTKVESIIKTVHVKGTTGTATCEHRMSGTMSGPDNKPAKMDFIGTSVDTYVKKDGKWLMSKMEWTANKMLMNGKPMEMAPGAQPAKKP